MVFHDKKFTFSRIFEDKLIISLVLAGLIVIFIAQNVSVVEIRFLFWKFAMSRSLMMFLTLAIGIIIGWSLHNHFKSYK